MRRQLADPLGDPSLSATLDTNSNQLVKLGEGLGLAQRLDEYKKSIMGPSGAGTVHLQGYHISDIKTLNPYVRLRRQAAMHIDQIMFGTIKTLKPTIVFVTGAWHKPHLYAGLLESLRKNSFPVVAPCLPSVGGYCDSFYDDVNVVRKAIADEVSQGHEIVMLMHSYGGVVGSAAVQGYSKRELPRGGGVIRMIYMAAFAMEEGLSLMDALNNTPLPWWRSANEKQWQATTPSHIFYNDVDASLAEACEAQLDLQAKGAFESKQTYAAWKHIDSTYIVCSRDNAIPKQAQEAMANQPGGRFTIEYLDAGHSPFLSMLHQTVKTIRETVGEPM